MEPVDAEDPAVAVDDSADRAAAGRVEEAAGRGADVVGGIDLRPRPDLARDVVAHRPASRECADRLDPVDPERWDDIPGARGCTAESCAFRDAREELARFGASLIGISTQTPEEQAEFAARERIAYPLLSDHELVLAREMGLPTFAAAGLRLYKRLTFVAEEGRILRVIYPVFPLDRNADEVRAWLEARAD